MLPRYRIENQPAVSRKRSIIHSTIAKSFQHGLVAFLSGSNGNRSTEAFEHFGKALPNAAPAQNQRGGIPECGFQQRRCHLQGAVGGDGGIPRKIGFITKQICLSVTGQGWMIQISSDNRYICGDPFQDGFDGSVLSYVRIFW